MSDKADVAWDDVEWDSDSRKVTERTHFIGAFSNVVAFETNEGVVLIDTGITDRLRVAEQTDAAPEMAAQLRRYTDAPIHTVVYTHGHADHVHGLEHFLKSGQRSPRIIAHENMQDRFARYERTPEFNEAINARQTSGTPVRSDDSKGGTSARFRPPDHLPNVLYDDGLTFEVGDTSFEVHHARGETDDHSWIYCPERDVLCSGDLFINKAPNAGNPQKVQRYPEEWAHALWEMAAKDPKHLCPGHGDPIIDEPDEVRAVLTSTASYLQSIVDQSIKALNEGAPPHVDIVHRVERPDTDAEWLEEKYDEAEFIVRNVIRKYGGWWSGRPSELKPAPRDTLAKEIAEMAGGPEEIAERAQTLLEADEYRLATHLADFALEAASENDVVQSAVIGVYEARAETEESLMATNLFLSAAAYAREGRDFS